MDTARRLEAVGCDAEGLEARMLGSYLHRYDGGAFSNMTINGNQEDKTDVHSANVRALVADRLLPPEALTCTRRHLI